MFWRWDEMVLKLLIDLLVFYALTLYVLHSFLTVSDTVVLFSELKHALLVRRQPFGRILLGHWNTSHVSSYIFQLFGYVS